MKLSNLGLCNIATCRARVPAEFFFRDNQVWIRKICPTCGPSESLVSSDAGVWQAKRDLWQYVPTDPEVCTLNCDRCGKDHKPNMVFLDVTNHCNMNCPICIATIRGMGFDFNPPLSYFEKIFAELGRMQPQPVVQLFGGEPTMREDLLEIIAIAKKNGLRPHVVTNGLRLADEEYCRKLCEAKVPMRFAFDGRSADIYERLRNNRGAYDKKMKALENLKKHSRRRHAIIACAAWGINDHLIGDMFQYCHDNRDLISDVGIIPLTENWEPGTFDAAKTTTMEDVEKMVQQAIPGGEVEFIPAGLAYALKKPRSFFRANPRSEVLLLAGVHPNCEAMTLLISDGKAYRGINHYLTKPFSQVAVECATLCRKIEPKLDRLDPTKYWQRLRGRMLLIRTLGPWVLRTIRFGRLWGNPITAVVKPLVARLRRKYGEHSANRLPRRILRVGMLPFEEQHSVDAARMENCKAVFAYEDVDDGKVKYIPACLWYPYRNAFLEKLSTKYGVAGKKSAAPSPASV
ncbi:MAG: radical SAM protein [Phycisphaerae bacterium]|jgi:hypothetical protein